MKKILVTGSDGFLGKHLCKRLSDHLVIGYDRPNDVIEPFDVEVDEIYNLACTASPKGYQRDPTHTLKTSVYGAVNVLEIAKRHGAKVLQASTSEIYGDPLSSPQRETDWGNVNPIGPRSCYDEGKRAAESLFMSSPCDTRIVRIFNTYGPGQDDGRVVCNFIKQALSDEPLTVYGEGTQTRSFCYVDDLIEGLVLLMEKGPKTPVNLGNPEEIGVLDLADLIIEMTGSKSRIHFEDLPEDDPVVRCPDITKAKKLGWEPKIDLQEGLKRIIQWQK